MPISIISLNLTALFLLFAALLVFFSWRKERSIFLKDFAGFLFGIAGASICWAIASWLVLMNLKAASYFHPVALISGGIGILYFCHLSLLFIVPKKIWKFLTILILLFLVSVISATLNLPTPYLNEKGIIIWNIGLLSGFITFVSGIVAVIFSLSIFIYLGIKATEKFIRLRSFLISLGIILYMGGGLGHNIAKTTMQYLLSDIATLLGVIVLLIAVYLKNFYNKKQKNT